MMRLLSCKCYVCVCGVGVNVGVGIIWRDVSCGVRKQCNDYMCII